jgi:hypothetical protein
MNMVYAELKQLLNHMSQEELDRPVRIVEVQEHNIFYRTVESTHFSDIRPEEVERFGKKQFIIRLDEEVKV